MSMIAKEVMNVADGMDKAVVEETMAGVQDGTLMGVIISPILDLEEARTSQCAIGVERVTIGLRHVELPII